MFKITINSTFGFYEKTLQILLPSLIKAGADKKDIVVFIGGSPYEYRRETVDDINYVFVNYDSFDLTTFICLLEHPEILIGCEKFLYLQDTCKAGPNFLSNVKERFEAIKSISKPEDLKCIKLSNDGFSMNMGIYDTSYITNFSNRDYVLSMKNYDFSEKGKLNSKVNSFKHEDYFFKDVAKHSLNEGYRFVSYVPNPYNGEAVRIQEYFNKIDFFKYKGNGGHNIGNGLPPVFTL